MSVEPLQLRAAKEIAKAFGAGFPWTNWSNGRLVTFSPEQIINISIAHFNSQTHTAPAWKTAAQMLTVASRMDIPFTATLTPTGLTESIDDVAKFIAGIKNTDRRKFAAMAADWYDQTGEFPHYGDARGSGSLSLNLLDREAIMSKLNALLDEDLRGNSNNLGIVAFNRYGAVEDELWDIPSNDLDDSLKVMRDQNPGCRLEVQKTDGTVIRRLKEDVDLPERRFIWSYVTKDNKFNGKLWRTGRGMMDLCTLEIFNQATGAMVFKARALTQRKANDIWKTFRRTNDTTGLEEALSMTEDAVKKVPVAGKYVPDTAVEKEKQNQGKEKIDFETRQERDLEAARRRDFDTKQNDKKAKLRTEATMNNGMSFNRFITESPNSPLPFFDASDLRWKPGYWPMTFDFPGFGPANRAELMRDNDNDVIFARYMTTDGKEVQVFND